MNTAIKGHFLAAFTMTCWGTTFISTKVLLETFTPIEILITRFVIALTILYLIRPQQLKLKREEHRLYFVLAGLSGVTLYYLLENIALTYTYASNVGIIMATAPFFAGILSYLVLRRRILNGPFFIGFAVAMAGVVLLNVGDHTLNSLQVNPLGDLLALGAAAVWAVYSVLLKKICTFDYDMITVTREIFLYGVILMIPPLILTGFDIDLIYAIEPVNLANLLYLGVGASAICFVTWNFATKYLGVVKTTAYIYASPVITVLAAYAILGEPFTIYTAGGMILAVTGLIISQNA